MEINPHIKSPTTIINCPVVNILQPFTRKNGTLVWRAAITEPETDVDQEHWYYIADGVLTLLEQAPTDLTDVATVTYLGPVKVYHRSTNAVHYRYNTVLANGTLGGFLYIDEKTGSMIQTGADDLTNNHFTTFSNEPVLLTLLRSQPVFDTVSQTMVMQEVWGHENDSLTRKLLYFEMGSERPLNNVVPRVMTGHCE